jgi:single-stranded DNA-binding protein
MEQTERPSNFLLITGTMSSEPVFSHDVFNEAFYQFSISVPRLSGAVDILPVTISERLLQKVDPSIGTKLRLEGQVRSYNKVINGSGRLLITAFAQKLTVQDDDLNPNVVQLVGTLCKPPAYRTTPFGREIADIMLAVNRSYGKSDYIPCIAWGRNARYASRLQVSEQVFMDGRMQSRAYQKLMPDGTKVEKTAYEISVGKLESIRNDNPSPIVPIDPADFTDADASDTFFTTSDDES